MSENVPITVLVVNDNEPQNYALSRILEHEGYKVLQAFSGQQALMEATKLPGIVLLDINMPDMMGFEVCRRLKKDAATANIPVVFVTATYQYSFAYDQVRSVGGDGLLFYPIESGELNAVVHGAMARAAKA